jgi:hypothetical protein
LLKGHINTKIEYPLNRIIEGITAQLWIPEGEFAKREQIAAIGINP